MLMIKVIMKEYKLQWRKSYYNKNAACDACHLYKLYIPIVLYSTWFF